MMKLAIGQWICDIIGRACLVIRNTTSQVVEAESSYLLLLLKVER